MYMYYVYEQRKDAYDAYNSSTSSVRNVVLATNDKDIADNYCKQKALWSCGNVWYWVEEHYIESLYVPCVK